MGQICSGTPQAARGFPWSSNRRDEGLPISEGRSERTGRGFGHGSRDERRDSRFHRPFLRNYDVLINFPDREFSIGLPGSLKFNGVKSKMLVKRKAPASFKFPARLKTRITSGTDIGSSISFLSEGLFDKLATANPEWPHMTGAVGPANMGEAE